MKQKEKQNCIFLLQIIIGMYRGGGEREVQHCECVESSLKHSGASGVEHGNDPTSAVKSYLDRRTHSGALSVMD